MLDAQRDLVGAQQTYLQVQRAQLDAATQLYKALGGGQAAEPPSGGQAAEAVSGGGQRKNLETREKS